MKEGPRLRLQKLARIDRELAATAARQAALYVERAALLDGGPAISLETGRKAPDRTEPEVTPVSSLAAQRAKAALQQVRTGRKVRA
jgi:hypothetical protein